MEKFDILKILRNRNEESISQKNIDSEVESLDKSDNSVEINCKKQWFYISMIMMILFFCIFNYFIHKIYIIHFDNNITLTGKYDNHSVYAKLEGTEVTHCIMQEYNQCIAALAFVNMLGMNKNVDFSAELSFEEDGIKKYSQKKGIEMVEGQRARADFQFDHIGPVEYIKMLTNMRVSYLVPNVFAEKGD